MKGTTPAKAKAPFERLPVYYQYLKSLQPNPPPSVSSATIAAALQLGDVQVRKDLASIVPGKPKLGYATGQLLRALEQLLGFDKTTRAVVVGAGKLGKALLNYPGFEAYSLAILAAFDTDAPSQAEGKAVYPLDDLPAFCRENDVKIGIITTPAGEAQRVCDLLVQSGVRAIWNFAPAHLNVPESILVRSENMANSLAVLSAQLTKTIQ